MEPRPGVRARVARGRGDRQGPPRRDGDRRELRDRAPATQLACRVAGSPHGSERDSIVAAV